MPSTQHYFSVHEMFNSHATTSNSSDCSSSSSNLIT
jgi:hypothetical protein